MRDRVVIYVLLAMGFASSLLLHSGARDHMAQLRDRVEVLETDFESIDSAHMSVVRNCEGILTACDGLREDLGDALDGCEGALRACERVLTDTEEPQ